MSLPNSVTPDLKVLDDLSLITDIVIDEPKSLDEPSDLATARAFTGAMQPFWLAPSRVDTDEHADRLRWVFEFYQSLREKHSDATMFRFTHGSHTFRAKRSRKASGAVRLSLRSIPQVHPVLSDLELPPYFADALQSDVLHRDPGLVLVVAPVGQGKTTTIGAALKTRSSLFGGLTTTVEDPCEPHLDGWHQGASVAGEICQYEVNSALPYAEQYPAAIRDALREFPQTRGSRTVFISEIRDPETAVIACQAAQAGFLVFATLHASGPINTVYRLITLLQKQLGVDNARDLVAGCLRLVMFQRLTLLQKPLGWKRGQYSGEMLCIPGPSHTAANVIRKGELGALQDTINSQQAGLQHAHANKHPYEQVYTELFKGAA